MATTMPITDGKNDGKNDSADYGTDYDVVVAGGGPSGSSSPASCGSAARACWSWSGLAEVDETIKAGGSTQRARWRCTGGDAARARGGLGEEPVAAAGLHR